MKILPQLRQRAFTLIEIMVAIAIFAIVVGAIYATWSLILRASQVGQDAAARIQRQRVAIRTISDAINCIQSFQASMQYYTFYVDNSDQSLFSFTARLPENFPRSGKFNTSLRRLTFTLEPGADQNETDLVLRQAPILVDMDEDEQNYPLVLARNVSAFTVECWDTNALDWVTEWDDTNSIPPMIRVSLALSSKPAVVNNNIATIGGNDPNVTLFTTEIAVPSITLPTVVQTGQGAGGGGGGGGGGGRNNNGRNQNGENNNGRGGGRGGGGGGGGARLQ